MKSTLSQVESNSNVSVCLFNFPANQLNCFIFEKPLVLIFDMEKSLFVIKEEFCMFFLYNFHDVVFVVRFKHELTLNHL